MLTGCCPPSPPTIPHQDSASGVLLHPVACCCSTPAALHGRLPHAPPKGPRLRECAPCAWTIWQAKAGRLRTSSSQMPGMAREPARGFGRIISWISGPRHAISPTADQPCFQNGLAARAGAWERSQAAFASWCLARQPASEPDFPATISLRNFDSLAQWPLVGHCIGAAVKNIESMNEPPRDARVTKCDARM